MYLGYFWYIASFDVAPASEVRTQDMINFSDFDNLRRTGEHFVESNLSGPPAVRAWRAKVIAWIKENRPDSDLAHRAAICRVIAGQPRRLPHCS